MSGPTPIGKVIQNLKQQTVAYKKSGSSQTAYGFYPAKASNQAVKGMIQAKHGKVDSFSRGFQ